MSANEPSGVIVVGTLATHCGPYPRTTSPSARSLIPTRARRVITSVETVPVDLTRLLVRWRDRVALRHQHRHVVERAPRFHRLPARDPVDRNPVHRELLLRGLVRPDHAPPRNDPITMRNLLEYSSLDVGIAPEDLAKERVRGCVRRHRVAGGAVLRVRRRLTPRNGRRIVTHPDVLEALPRYGEVCALRRRGRRHEHRRCRGDQT